MATALERMQTAWSTGDPLALHREVEKLAAEGHARQALEDALEALLLTVRAGGGNDEAEEIINGVWDRLTGWCHSSRHIAAPGPGNHTVDPSRDGATQAPLVEPTALP